ncbi:hypothetical protein [Stenotrophomonas sp. GZD-301]|uniref:hypothetical protein n=1 Tax=Stenotrophomonas sp. GZD-301 TaxID=3404814 RepID=UPI003BB55BA2
MTTTGNVDRRACRYWLGAALTVLLAGCGDAPPADPGKPARRLDSHAPATPAPAAPVNDDQRLLAFLHDRYGAKATLDTAWKDQWDDPDQEATRPVERRLCARQTVAVTGQAHQLVAVCQTIEDVASVEPGRIDLYVLRDGEAVAEHLLMYSGMRGMPGTVAIDTLGPERPAFRITDGWYGQGYSLVSRTYVALHDNRLTPVASFRDHIDNDSAYDCDEDPSACANRLFNIDFSVTADMQALQDGYAALDVRGQGPECAGPTDEHYRLVYDPAKGAYPIPDALLREQCRE